jgi:ABC-type multidrug transport system fused ATPase/permease subunit
MYDEDYEKSLKSQIWATRVSRINAEMRLKSKETFIQTINIYYSCFTVFLSIYLLVKQDFAYSLLTLIMTIVLMVSILYFKSLKYTERALDYRKNYTDLQKLEFKLSHKEIDAEQIHGIEEDYCKLLAAGENHIEFDYLKTLAQSKIDYKKERWTREKVDKYYWNLIWRFVLKTFCIILPLLLLLLIYCWKAHGWLNSL